MQQKRFGYGQRGGGDRAGAAREYAGAGDGERPFLAALAVRPSLMAAYAAAFLAATLFSAKGIFAKKAYDAGASPETLLALRFGMASPVFAWVALSAGGIRLGSLSRRDWFLVCLLGIGILLSSVLDFHGLRYISVGLERMILYTYPAMVLLLSAWLARRRPGRAALAALGLSYAGLGLAFFGEAGFVDRRSLLIGGSFVLASALVYACALIVSDRAGKRIGSQRVMAMGMLACTAIFLPLAIVGEGEVLWHQQPAAYGWAALMAVLGTIAPVLFMAYAIKKLGAARMSIVGTAGAVSVLPLAALILGEQAGWAQWAGFALTIAGGVVLARK
jgi:drug/metabolite transporter (DMT)-like permease